jgi:hypothetical protein
LTCAIAAFRNIHILTFYYVGQQKNGITSGTTVRERQPAVRAPAYPNEMVLKDGEAVLTLIKI